jgi:hypothetical protein
MLGGALQVLTWPPGGSIFSSDAGGTFTVDELKGALVAGDAMLLYGALPPGQGSAPNPKLRSASRSTSPILCSEAPAVYHATLQTGETAVALELQGIDVVAGSRVLVDGQVTGAPLAGSGPNFPWIMPQAPGAPTILALQVLSPTGMQSNSVSLPVVPPVVPAYEPDDLAGAVHGPLLELSWTDQFGLTGPGTRYDVFRGRIEDLNTPAGLSAGECFGSALHEAGDEDAELPLPGQGFYYVIRAQNQLNVTSWGSEYRDQKIAASPYPCPALF